MQLRNQVYQATHMLWSTLLYIKPLEVVKISLFHWTDLHFKKSRYEFCFSVSTRRICFVQKIGWSWKTVFGWEQSTGDPLKVSTCHKMWTTLFLKAGKDFASYPKKITYSLFRAQARKGLFISMTIWKMLIQYLFCS